MMKKGMKTSRFLAWLTAFGLAASSIMATPVYAEDAYDEYSTVASDWDGEDGSGEEGTVLNNFTITAFPDFTKTSEGKYEKTEIQDKYGDLTATTGATYDDLGLPTTLTVEGYFPDTDGATQSYTLQDISWGLKNEDTSEGAAAISDETYSEDSPAGEYTFVPDLEDYVLSQAADAAPYFDSLSTQDGVDLPELTVTIHDPVAETEVTEDTEATADNPDGTVDDITDGTITDDSDGTVNTDGSDDTVVVVDGSDANTDQAIESESTDSFDEGIDFDNLDDSTINAGDGDVDSYSDGDDSSNINTVDENTSDDGNTNNISIIDNQGVGPAIPPTIEVEITITDANGNTASYVDADGNTTFTANLDSETGDNAEITLPSDSTMDLTNVTVSFTDATTGNVIDGFTSDSATTTQDFSAEPTESYTFYPSDDNESAHYTVNLTVAQEQPVTYEDLPVTITISDGSGSGTAFTTCTAHVNAANGDAATITLPSDSNLDLTNIMVSFTNTNTGATIDGFTPNSSTPQDFSENAAKNFIMYPDATRTNTYYSVNLTVTKNQPVDYDDLAVTISISDNNGNTASYANGDTNNILNVTANTENGASATIALPCNSALDMTNLNVSFMNGDKSQTYGFTTTSSSPADFSAEGTKTYTYCPNGSGTEPTYTIALTVTKNAHTPGAEATCTQPQVCTVCNAVLVEAKGHIPGAAATCTTDQTCTVCGAVLAKAKGHTPGPAATCTTDQTCTICGAVLTPATGHKWAEATCTKPKTCTVCGAQQGKALGHALSEWQTITASTQSEHGKEARYCTRTNCDYSEEKELNIIGDPANNYIANLENGASYKLKETLTFSAVGAGMANTNPINGDVRYVPSSWKIQNTPGTFKDNFTGSFAITIAGSYTLTVTYQKQVYDNGWQVTDIADSKSITFTVGTLIEGQSIEGTENGIRINPATGDTTNLIPFVSAAVVAIVAIVVGVIFKKRRK